MDLNAWEAGKEAELAFWRKWLASKGKAYERLNRLHDKFTPMIGTKKRIKIANLGAGPVCLIGDRRRDVAVTVVSSDIFANEYKKLLKELNLKSATTVKRQDMTRVCRPGGWIYLWHIAHEGQRQRYRGLHKWNIDLVEDGDCIVWNNTPGPQTDVFWLSEIYPSFKTTIQLMRKAALVTSLVQKHV